MHSSPLRPRLVEAAVLVAVAPRRELGLDEAYAYASEVMTRNLLARDAEEGIDAFLGKRPPVWEGR